MFGLLRRGTEKRSCGVKKLRRITTSQRNLMEVHEPRFSWCKNREPQLVASTTPRGSEREALKRRPGKKNYVESDSNTATSVPCVVASGRAQPSLRLPGSMLLALFWRRPTYRGDTFHETSRQGETRLFRREVLCVPHAVAVAFPRRRLPTPGHLRSACGASLIFGDLRRFREEGEGAVRACARGRVLLDGIDNSVWGGVCPRVFRGELIK